MTIAKNQNYQRSWAMWAETGTKIKIQHTFKEISEKVQKPQNFQVASKCIKNEN